MDTAKTVLFVVGSLCAACVTVTMGVAPSFVQILPAGQDLGDYATMVSTGASNPAFAWETSLTKCAAMCKKSATCVIFAYYEVGDIRQCKVTGYSWITGATSLPGARMFKKGLAAGTNMGCYKDSKPDGMTKVLWGKENWDGLLTRNKCMQTCVSSNFTYYGVQSGQWCNCGNEIFLVKNMNSDPAPATECQLSTCGGEVSETCGGPDRVDVYYTGL